MEVTVTIPPALTRTLHDLAHCQSSVLEGAAMGIEALLRDHFTMLQSRPRKDGLAAANFWIDVGGNSVAEHIVGGGELGNKNKPAHIMQGNGVATIGIDDKRLAHKMTGGTIEAKDYGHTYLTIPATDEAVKAPRGARSFTTHIEWQEHPSGGMRPALVQGTERGSGSVLFWLVKKVTHQPMPDALPSQRDLDDAAYAAALDVIDAMLQGAA